MLPVEIAGWRRGRGAQQPEDHIDGALDGTVTRRDGVDHGARQHRAEDHVEDVAGVHGGVDAGGRRGAQDLLELGPRRDPQVQLGRARGKQRVRCLVIRQQAGRGGARGGRAERRHVGADEPAQIAPEVSRRADRQRTEPGERGLLDQLDPRRPAAVDGGGVHARARRD